MTDETLALLSALGALCKGNGFAVVEEEELCSCLPAGTALSPLLEELSERRLIEIRYAEEGTYCVRVLTAGRDFLPRLRADGRRAASELRRIFLCAALGGFAGGLFSALMLVALFL